MPNTKSSEIGRSKKSASTARLYAAKFRGMAVSTAMYA